MDGVQFPVAPSKFSVKTSGKNETVELVSGGEASFLKSPGLVEFSFDVLLPYFKYPFAEYPDGFKDPDVYKRQAYGFRSIHGGNKDERRKEFFSGNR